MLSILIPIHNVKIRLLVDELIEQCQKAKIGFEILCFDDFSTSKFREKNCVINGLFNVNYVEISENIGRAKTRNRMAKIARYDALLFLDADSRIPSKKFVKNYIRSANNDHAIVGGTMYKKNPPKDNQKLLHWAYGSKREAVSLQKKRKHPSRYFHSNNFLISRDHILSHPFPEIDGYGYEDIAMGESLQRAGISIRHIDNPVVHLGLKNQSDFLTDQKSAMRNLAKLYREKSISDTRLIKWYELLKKFGLLRWMKSFDVLNEEKLLTRLSNNQTNLKTLDLLKLYYFDKALSDYK